MSDELKGQEKVSYHLIDDKLTSVECVTAAWNQYRSGRAPRKGPPVKKLYGKYKRGQRAKNGQQELSHLPERWPESGTAFSEIRPSLGMLRQAYDSQHEDLLRIPPPRFQGGLLVRTQFITLYAQVRKRI
jgi:hypothetical protein